MGVRDLQNLMLGAVVLVGITACNNVQPPGALATKPAWRPECPGGDTLAISVIDSIVRIRGKVWYFAHTVTQVPLAGDRSKVPEFQDCQRFVVGDVDKPAYDSLYAIFAADHAHQEMLADSVDTLPYSSTKRGWPAAEIMSYGGTYPTLGIEPDFNCLYLYRDGSTWQARMVPIGSVEKNCDLPLRDPANAAGTTLSVIVSAAYGSGDPDFPETARWDWDSKHSKQYIGLKCGAGWCEVGAEGFRPSSPESTAPAFRAVSGPPPTGAERKRVWNIKGWYDGQLLAVWDDVNKRPMPGRVWGTVIPHPVLGRSDHNSVAYFSPPWVSVAVVRVSDDYSTKYVRFKKGENQVWLCAGASGDCGVPDDVPTCPSTTGVVWWTKMQPDVGGEPFYRCVIMRSHSNPDIPGTTRWRWAETDETSWIRCTGGCCEIH